MQAELEEVKKEAELERQKSEAKQEMLKELEIKKAQTEEELNQQQKKYEEKLEELQLTYVCQPIIFPLKKYIFTLGPSGKLKEFWKT